MREFYATRYGVEPSNLTVYVPADIESGSALHRELTGREWSPQAPFKAFTGTFAEHGRVLFLGSSGSEGPVAHEYFHVLQHELLQLGPLGSDPSPWWLIEGSAVYAHGLNHEAQGLRTHQDIRDTIEQYSATVSEPLRSLESREALLASPQGYALGELATWWLVQRAGDSSWIDYWRLLAESATWQEAFASAFNITVDDFYKAFEEYRSALPIVSSIQGSMLGPDSGPLGGVGVWAWETSENNRFTATYPDGTFDIVVSDGAFTIGIYVLEAGAWRHIGWYGEGGFTTDREQATVIEVDGEDVTGLEIRLPADPEDLPTIE